MCVERIHALTDALKQKDAHTSSSLSSASSAHAALQSSHLQLTSRYDQLATSYSKLQSELRSLTTAQEQLTADKQSITDKHMALLNENRELRQSIDTATKHHGTASQSLVKELADARVKITSLESVNKHMALGDEERVKERVRVETTHRDEINKLLMYVYVGVTAVFEQTRPTAD